MKHAIKISALAVSLIFAAAAHATQPAASASGNFVVNSGVTGNFATNQGGNSFSTSFNTQNATASVTSQANHNLTYTNVSALTSGKTTTEGHAGAYNVSSGNANGSAVSAGSAGSWVQGSESIHGVGSGNGFSGASNVNNVTAYTNQGGENAAATGTGFSSGLDYTYGRTVSPVLFGGTVTTTAGATTSTSGYAGGSSAVWNGAELGVAGLANGAATNNVSTTGNYGSWANAAGNVGNSVTFNGLGFPQFGGQ